MNGFLLGIFAFNVFVAGLHTIKGNAGLALIHTGLAAINLATMAI